MTKPLQAAMAAFRSIPRGVCMIAMWLVCLHAGMAHAANPPTESPAFDTAIQVWEQQQFDAAATGFQGVLNSHPDAALDAKAAFNLEGELNRVLFSSLME